jgi:hypothetical protein
MDEERVVEEQMMHPRDGLHHVYHCAGLRGGSELKQVVLVHVDT